MQTIAFSTLSSDDQEQLRAAVERIPRALNKKSNPQTSVVLTTSNGRHFGNNIFLSNCTLSCGEANALGAAVAAGDTKIEKLYLAVGRPDTSAPNIISPCGNCRQMLHDFSLISGKAITVYCTTNQLQEVLVTDSDELLPEGFKSASLGTMASDAPA